MENILTFKQSDFKDGFLATVARLQAEGRGDQLFGSVGFGGIHPLDPMINDLSKEELRSLDAINYAFTSKIGTEPVVLHNGTGGDVVINLDNIQTADGATTHSICSVLTIWLKERSNSHGYMICDLLCSEVEIRPGRGYSIDGCRYGIDGFAESTAEADKFKGFPKNKRALLRSERIALLQA